MSRPEGPSRSVVVEEPGALTTVQDAGRPGHAHLGVPRSGWLDDPAARLANRLVGNDDGAALLENVMGGLRLRWESAGAVGVCGAAVEVRVDGRVVDAAGAVAVPAGATVSLGSPAAGLRCYVAPAGGVDVPPELGSRATDTLSGLGPPPLRTGQRLALGAEHGVPSGGEQAPAAPVSPVVLRCVPGPRADWCPPGLPARLAEATYAAARDSDRVGLRLEGPALARREGELASEGVVLGAVQLPPDGRPVVFLNDHPTTGGYPVVAVVVTADLARCAQLRPGDEVRFSPRPGPGWP